METTSCESHLLSSMYAAQCILPLADMNARPFSFAKRILKQLLQSNHFNDSIIFVHTFYTPRFIAIKKALAYTQRSFVLQ